MTLNRHSFVDPGDVMEPTRIGSRLFVGRATRDVFVGEDGRQFVLDDGGNRVHGVWIYIPELDPDPESWRRTARQFETVSLRLGALHVIIRLKRV